RERRPPAGTGRGEAHNAPPGGKGKKSADHAVYFMAEVVPTRWQEVRGAPRAGVAQVLSWAKRTAPVGSKWAPGLVTTPGARGGGWLVGVRNLDAVVHPRVEGGAWRNQPRVYPEGAGDQALSPQPEPLPPRPHDLRQFARRPGSTLAGMDPGMS